MTGSLVPAGIARLVARATRPPIQSDGAPATNSVDALPAVPANAPGSTVRPAPVASRDSTAPYPPSRATPAALPHPSLGAVRPVERRLSDGRADAPALRSPVSGAAAAPSHPLPPTPLDRPDVAAADRPGDPTPRVQVERVPLAVAVSTDTGNAAHSQNVHGSGTGETVQATRTELVAVERTRDVLSTDVGTAAAELPPPPMPAISMQAADVGSVPPPATPPSADTRPASAAPRPAEPEAPVPVQIGRIEVQVAAPPAETDPFAGCRALEDGLTARRGGAW
jgi:hypothetical protein